MQISLAKNTRHFPSMSRKGELKCSLIPSAKRTPFILMKKRLSILDENGIKLKDITKIIQSMKPLDGAVDFLNWLRENIQVIIVSDTFVEFAGPLLEKLGWPTLFCHSLSVGPDGSITGYNLRQQDGKQKNYLLI